MVLRRRIVVAETRRWDVSEEDFLVLALVDDGFWGVVG